MTQDEIIEMAREAGLYQDINVSFHQALRNFYNLAIAKEREACSPRNADGSCPSSQRTWVGLTDVEIDYLLVSTAGENEETHITFARAIEAKLKQKNGFTEEKNT